MFDLSPVASRVGGVDACLFVLGVSSFRMKEDTYTHLTYDLTTRWSIGGKYAYRLGQASLDRENQQFFDNNAHLYIARADYRFGHNWEGLLEGRLLSLPDINERRSGALVAGYRYLGEHMKLGVGYNFTDFSDDLTDLSYNQQGVFINVVGAM